MSWDMDTLWVLSFTSRRAVKDKKAKEKYWPKFGHFCLQETGRRRCLDIRLLFKKQKAEHFLT